MRWMVVWVMALAGGCGPYLDTQIRLTEQAQRGIVLASEAQQRQKQCIDEVYDLRRARLDEAFDEDVRHRPVLDAGWVIEHRKAYAVGLESMESQRASRQRAVESAEENLRATHQALAKLQWLLSVQAGWMKGGSDGQD